MLLKGEWYCGDDGVIVPTVAARFTAADGREVTERFLIDSGADCTLLTVGLLRRLAPPEADTDAGRSLSGLGGAQRTVNVTTAFALRREDGSWVTFNGRYAALLEDAAFDISLLGRDVLNLFDVILSRRQQQVLLLGGNHTYTVQVKN